MSFILLSDAFDLLPRDEDSLARPREKCKINSLDVPRFYNAHGDECLHPSKNHSGLVNTDNRRNDDRRMTVRSWTDK